MNEKDKQQLIEEARKCTKEQLLEMYADEFEESFTLSDLWCKSQEENKRLNNTIKQIYKIFKEGRFEDDCDCIQIEELITRELKGSDKE